MTAPVVLSASSVQTFLRCGHQWYLAYVVGLREPPNFAMTVGLATHSAIEHNFLQKVSSKEDVTAEEMVDVFSDNFDSLAAEVEDDKEDPGEAKDSGVKLVRLHRREVSPAIQPVWVEQAGQFEIDGIPYSFTVDVTDDKLRVRDTKTKKQAPSSIEEYMLGMTGYALGFRHETGQVETDVVIDALVRSKVPRYVPLYGGQVDDRRITAFRNTIHTISEGVGAGSFEPNGLAGKGVCDWCGFRNRCKYQGRS